MDMIVEHDAPLIELAPPVITDVERAIGEYCASLIRDGDCLQLGIGAIPDAVLLSLKNKKDLGIHSEMFQMGSWSWWSPVLLIIRKRISTGTGWLPPS